MKNTKVRQVLNVICNASILYAIDRKNAANVSLKGLEPPAFKHKQYNDEKNLDKKIPLITGVHLGYSRKK